MAEAFGVAAGAIGVAGFALQLGESIAKIKSFCDRVRDAPIELQEYVEELEITRKMIKKIDAEAPCGSMDRALLQESLALCREAIKRITAVADQLEKGMLRKRYRTSIKMILKEEVIARMLQKLARAKEDLHMAYTQYTSSQLEARTSRLMDDATQLKGDTSRLINTTSRVNDEVLSHRQLFASLQAGQDSQMQLLRNIATLASSVSHSGNVQAVSQLSPADVNGHKRWYSTLRSDTKRYKLGAPTWLWSRIWDIEVTRAIAGWKFSLRSYRIISYYHPVWGLIREGDTEGVRRLLDLKQVCMSDQDCTGHSLFSIAVGYLQTDTARFLFENGVNSNMAAEPPCDAHLEYRMFYSALVFNAVAATREHLSFLDDCGYEVNNSLLRILAKPLASIPDEERLWVLSGTWGAGPPSSSLFWEFIGKDHIDPALWLCTTGPAQLLHCIASLWGLDCSPSSRYGCPGWRALVQEGALVGADLHAVRDQDVFIATPLLDFIYGALDVSIDDVSPRVRQWAEALYSVGVDLQSYALIETGYFDDWLQHLRTSYWSEAAEFDELIIGLKSGPKPEDWGVWQRHPGDEYAGMFWDLLDHPERAMPGAWNHTGDGEIEVATATSWAEWRAERRAEDGLWRTRDWNGQGEQYRMHLN
ncbi:hypothetical protein LTR85_006509 [Meristemomyces frigidus]|nr:hypothetical protein LTR85_006509 [Meristemomyces frigidus]